VFKRRFALAFLLVLSVLALVACGSSGNDDESKVEEAIETSATSTDPADCTKLETQQFMEQTTQESGKAAVEKCEEEAKKEEGAESAEVASVSVNGSTATAEATLTGGSLGGQTVEVELVKAGDQWKLNEVVKFTKFDQAALVKAFKQELSKASSEISPRFAACFVKALEETDQAEIEAMIFGGNAKAFEEIAEGCP
jgi:hypothetical protein